MLINNSSQSLALLDKIHSGEITPIGWGCGQIFKLRHFIHKFEVNFTIHTHPPTLEMDHVPVKDPSALERLDHSKHILIIYTIDYIDEVLRYCKPYPLLLTIPFNAAELGVSARLRELRIASEVLCEHGVSYGTVSQLHRELGY